MVISRTDTVTRARNEYTLSTSRRSNVHGALLRAARNQLQPDSRSRIRDRALPIPLCGEGAGASTESHQSLRDLFDQQRTREHDERLAAEAAAAAEHDFVQRYAAHRKSVIEPTLEKLKRLVAEYGHDLLIDGETDDGLQNAASGPIQATLLLKGDDESSRSARPQLKFSANPPSQKIDVYGSEHIPHEDGAPGEQAGLTIEELSAARIEEMFVAIVRRAFAD